MLDYLIRCPNAFKLTTSNQSKCTTTTSTSFPNAPSLLFPPLAPSQSPSIPMHNSSIPSLRTQAEPKSMSCFPSHMSVDIKFHHPPLESLTLILSLNLSLSLLIPILLTLSLGATLAAYPVPLTILTGSGTCLALSTSLS